MFEIVDDRRTDDGRTPEHGYTISSPCEPKGSGELINTVFECQHLGSGSEKDRFHCTEV